MTNQTNLLVQMTICDFLCNLADLDKCQSHDHLQYIVVVVLLKAQKCIILIVVWLLDHHMNLNKWTMQTSLTTLVLDQGP